jgi:uncharacterized protein (DUF1330 family)
VCKDAPDKGGSAVDRIYAILDVTIFDQEKFKKYVNGHLESLHQYGGSIVFRSKNLECIEGDWSPKLLVMQQWPSVEAFKVWYGSLEYRPWKLLREEACQMQFILTKELF